MALTVVLAAVAILLIVSALSLLLHGTALGRILIYGGSLALCGIGLVVGLSALLGQAPPETLMLPIELPWLGAHFRLDALSAFFLVVVNLGGAAASLYALGFGRHETAPQRVLPFYPLFLAAMTLVVIADDAFTFLFSWEFMSLSSWALVMAHDHVRENLRAGYVYLVMASFGTFALLLAFGLLAGPDGAYAFDALRATHPSATLVALVLVLVLIGTGSKVSCRCMPGCRSPTLPPRATCRAYERGDDQGRGLCLRAHRVRPVGRSSLVPASPASWACSTR